MSRREWARVPWTALVASALVLSVGADAAATAKSLTLDGAISRALATSPALREAQAEVALETGETALASRLVRDNPEVAFDAGSRSRGDERFTDYGVTVEQRIEIGGQRALRGEASSARVTAARAKLAERQAGIVRDVRAAFVRVLAAERRRVLVADALEVARRAMGAVEERHGAGDATLIEVNAARVELGRAVRDDIRATEQEKVARRELSSLIGAGPEEQVSLAGTLEPLREAKTGDPAALVQRALRERSALVAARADLAASQAAAELAAREAIPSPRIGASYEKEEDTDVVRGLLTFDLPLFDRNDAERSRAASAVRVAEARIAALERDVSLEIELAAQRVDAAERSVAAFGAEVLAALDHNGALVQEGYDAGRIDFVQLLAMRRELLSARLEHLESLEDLERARAELDRAAGSTP